MIDIKVIKHRMTGYGNNQFTLNQYCKEFLVGESEAWRVLGHHRLNGMIQIIDYTTFITFRVTTKPAEIRKNLRENLRAFLVERNKQNEMIKLTRKKISKICMK